MQRREGPAGAMESRKKESAEVCNKNSIMRQKSMHENDIMKSNTFYAILKMNFKSPWKCSRKDASL